MAAVKLSHAECATLNAGLASLRAVLVRKSRAESNPTIVEIINKDIGALDVLSAKVSNHELEV